MKIILAAVDSSGRAPMVLAAACALARRSQGKVVLFRAVGLPHDLPVEAYAVSPDDVVNVLEERARRELAELARAAAGVDCEIRVAIGTAWEAICREARDVGAAIIVIGSHGYGGLERLLGTTAARVVNHADRSVFVVRSSELLE
jgi:nucleotide-binding universal stress UspA family protein